MPDEIRADRVYKGTVVFVGAVTFDDTVNLLDGVSIDAAAIDSGLFAHERGGLELDVSAFAGLVKISGGATSQVTVTSFGESLLDDADAATARTTLGLAIGSDVQAYDADLAAIAALTGTGFLERTADNTWQLSAGGGSGAWGDLTDIPAAIDAIDGLTPAADRLAYYTGASTADLAALTTFGRSLIDDTDAAAARSTLGLGTVATLNSITLGTDTTGDYVETITGTANQVTASAATGSVTLSLPQDIDTGAGPQFERLGLGAAPSPTHGLYVAENAAIIGGLEVHGDVEFMTPLPVSYGGTNAATAADARSNLGLGNVEDTALSTWTGSSNITTLGTITTGVWTGTTIAVANGGTGATTAADARTSLGVGTSDAPQFGGLGVGVAGVAGEINLVGGSGILITANNDTHNTNKSARWGVLHYDSTEEPFYAAVFSNSSANNIVNWGGGTSQGNAATRHDFFTASNNTTTTGTRRGSINNAGNLLWGTLTSPTTAAGVWVLANGTAPTAYPANQITMWAESGELKVADAAGNVTTLSPHSDQGPPDLYDEPPGIEWVTPHVNAFTGEVRWYNATRLFRQHSQPAGQRKPALIVETFDQYNTRLGLSPGDAGYLAPLDWDAHEDWLAQEQERERAEWRADREALPKDERDALRPEPPVHVKRPRPAWANRGKAA